MGFIKNHPIYTIVYGSITFDKSKKAQKCINKKVSRFIYAESQEISVKFTQVEFERNEHSVYFLSSSFLPEWSSLVELLF